MQLTNIIRDVKEDAGRDRVYIPLDEMARFGYTEEDLKAGVVDERFRGLMALQAERARGYFESGARLVPLLSAETRACTSVLAALYSTILDRIEESGFDVFERRVGLSASEKLLLMARLWALSFLPRLPIPGR
jgi:phytoene synthase